MNNGRGIFWREFTISKSAGASHPSGKETSEAGAAALQTIPAVEHVNGYISGTATRNNRECVFQGNELKV